MRHKCFDCFDVGAVLRHRRGKTLTAHEHHLFCLMTLMCHPLHLDSHYAYTATRHRRPLVVGSYVYSLLLGLSRLDTSHGTIVSSGYRAILHLAPVFHGDTIYAESLVLDRQVVPDHPDRHIVTIETSGRNQRGERIMSFHRDIVINPVFDTRARRSTDRVTGLRE